MCLFIAFRCFQSPPFYFSSRIEVYQSFHVRRTTAIIRYIICQGGVHCSSFVNNLYIGRQGKSGVYRASNLPSYLVLIWYYE